MNVDLHEQERLKKELNKKKKKSAFDIDDEDENGFDIDDNGMPISKKSILSKYDEVIDGEDSKKARVRTP